MSTPPHKAISISFEFAKANRIVQRFMAMERLILFDIDGTLTRTQNGYIPFNRAIFDTFGVAGDIRWVFPDGMTDPRILEEIFAKAEAEITVSDEQLGRFSTNLAGAYAGALQDGTTAVGALGGAAELLERLALNGEFAQGVVTGNFEATARIKLQAAGLASHLNFGAYASDSSYRPDLPAIAKQRWEKSTGRLIGAEFCIIVGDTPKDLEAARDNGMKCVLVGTGRYAVEDLRYYSPDACVADLTDTAEIVDLLRRI
jgi:phosphoglycolate phosphatase-like HAD superfamily hydrolase